MVFSLLESTARPVVAFATIRVQKERERERESHCQWKLTLKRNEMAKKDLTKLTYGNSRGPKGEKNNRKDAFDLRPDNVVG